MWENPRIGEAPQKLGLHSNLHFQSKLFMCALLSLQLCLTKFCLFCNGLIIIPMLILVIRGMRNKSQKRRHINIYKHTHTHTHCVYIYVVCWCYRGSEGGHWNSAGEWCNNICTWYSKQQVSGSECTQAYKKQIKNVHGHAHQVYIVWACWNLLANFVNVA